MIAAILHFVGGIVARFLGPILAGAAGWFSRGQREKIKDLKADKATRERIDNAPVHTDSDAATDWLRKRAAKRDLRRD